jgi:NAD(P)-dependent dehydrogenase (short-subunit alcohol dehydrogenase family)
VLDAAGARLLIVARRKRLLDELAAELSDPVVVAADLTAPGGVGQVLADVGHQFGAVDVLVNNAGITHVGPAEDEDLDTFRAVHKINVEVPFELTCGCASLAWDRSARLSVINISSIFGLRASRGVPEAAYASAKGAVTNLTRELANQWARRDIRVNAIAPGWFRSEITAAGMLEDPAGARYVRRYTPMGRPGHPNELDGALLFLASDASSYVTGQVLAVDGGWSIV